MTEKAFNITFYLFESAKHHPEKIAIVHKNQCVNFATLAQQVKDTANWFYAKGIRKGDRVLVFVPMSIELYRTILALLYMGAVAVFLDEWVSVKRLNACCKVADCKAFVGIGKVHFFAFFIRSLRKIPIKLSTKWSTSPNEIRYETDKDDIALLTFTTGSTGTPKAAVRTHNLLEQQFVALKDILLLQQSDIVMSNLPIVLLIGLAQGCTAIIPDFSSKKPQKNDPASICNQIEQQGVTKIMASPFFIQQISDYLLESKRKLGIVSALFTGGAPVFPKQVKLFNLAFPNVPVTIVYGSTEAEPISSITGIALLKESESLIDYGLPVGIPAKNTRVLILPFTKNAYAFSNTDALENATLENGTIGEIIVSGPQVLEWYYNNTEAKILNKIEADNTIWHRTGDSGFIKNGHLYLTGRCSELIELHGATIAPFVYENLLQSLPNVVLAAVFKYKDSLLAVAELAPETSAKLTVASIKKDFALIEEVLVVEKIPRDPRHFSKIDYAKLRKIVARYFQIDK